MLTCNCLIGPWSKEGESLIRLKNFDSKIYLGDWYFEDGFWTLTFRLTIYRYINVIKILICYRFGNYVNLVTKLLLYPKRDMNCFHGSDAALNTVEYVDPVNCETILSATQSSSLRYVHFQISKLLTKQSKKIDFCPFSFFAHKWKRDEMCKWRGAPSSSIGQCAVLQSLSYW